MPKLDFTKQLFKEDLAETQILPVELDADYYVQQFARHEHRILLMATEAAALEIVDQQTKERAVSMGTNANKAVKELNALRDQIIKPHKAFSDSVKQACGMYTKKLLDMIITPLKGKVSNRIVWEEMEEKKRLAKEKKDAEDLQKKINKDAKKLGIPAPQVDIPETKKKIDTKIKTSVGTGYGQKRWTYEVEDIEKVPRKHLKLDKGSVMRAVNSGERNIKGIRIFQKTGVAFKG